MRSIFRRTLQLLTYAERRRFALLVTFNTLVCITDIVSLALLVLVIGFYTQGNTTYLSFLPPAILDRSSISLALITFVFFAAKNLVGMFTYHAQFRYAYNVATRMSSGNLRRYFDGTYADHVNIPPAAHVRRINDHTIQFASYVLFGMYSIITEYILAGLTVTCMLLFNAKMFCIVFALLIPPVLLAGYYTRRRLRNARTHVKQTSETALQHLHEALSGYVEANVYHKTSFLLGRFINRQRQLNRFLSDVLITQGLPARLIEVFAVLGLLILIGINSMGSPGNTAIINIGAFMVVAYKLIPGIVRISNLTAQLRTYEYILNDMPPPAYPEKTETSGQTITSIRFNKVSYTYNKESKPLYADFEIPAGSFIGITGSSGRGKTTLINLLLGFIKPDEGGIEINGSPAGTDQLEMYRREISYVRQQAYLIHDTILKNIMLSDEPPTDKLTDILYATGLDHVIAEHTEGLNMTITDHGRNISGGQRQRIAIARALYKDAGVILLDEAFNELDNASEQELLHYFKQLANSGKIVVLITHNQQSLTWCDRVIAIE